MYQATSMEEGFDIPIAKTETLKEAYIEAIEYIKSIGIKEHNLSHQAELEAMKSCQTDDYQYVVDHCNTDGWGIVARQMYPKLPYMRELIEVIVEKID